MTTFFSTQDFCSVQSGAADTVQSLSNTVLEAAYKITLLNLEMTRNALNHGAASALAGLGEEARNADFKPITRDVATYFKNLAHITAETQVEVARQMQSQMSEVSKSMVSLLDRASKSDNNFGAAIANAALKSALATAAASCQSMTETARRVTEMAEANASALANTVQTMAAQAGNAAQGSFKKAA